jgi:hypothetical protein
LITREKKKTGEKLLRIVRSGRASPPPPAAAAAAATAQQPSSPLVRPFKALRAMGTTSSSLLRYRRSAAA